MTTMHTNLRGLALLGALVLVWPATTGCDSESSLEPPAPTAPEDAGADAGGAGGDAGADAGPLRQLTSKRLFGLSPVENWVMDANLTAVNGSTWWAATYPGWGPAQLTPVFQRTPADQPALRLTLVDGAVGSVMGWAKSPGQAAEASVWLGRQGQSASFVQSQAVLLGMFIGVGDAAVDLEMDEATDPVTLDGVTWQRWSAVITDDMAGWAHVLVSEGSSLPLFFSSPALVVLAEQSRRQGRPWATPRPRRAHEKQAIADRERRVRRPPKRTGRPLPMRGEP